ncbi:Transthyretin-like family protein [Caenorhabditis elegans]|uniref:Transthyretin-like family protein n=1 Tax=Caenorhabditis elegans TaxID=6239 RepID=O17776_CAEEL|nr:Transthyretin-like family protein [Caenorhabditis elegans]CAB02900.1 Transthyretin-like family protein [Caenorhabditis elegans]|eukprot:NP_506433.1 TransThyretin-Related family domain [Caenorhabditis elegans]
MTLISLTLLVAFLVFAQLSDAVLNVVGSTQTITVTGRLVCQGQPARNVLVKMYEDGTIWDSKLDSTKSANDGTFRVAGTYTKIFTLDPKVNIYHQCNYNGLCSKKLTINIPDYAVASGSGSSTNYDIGTLNLANQFSGETTDCIH